MTVNSLTSSAEFATNGVTTNFPFYFKFMANEDLVVTYINPAGVSSVLSLGSQYIVNGAGDEGGGSISTFIPLLGPGQLVVSREMDAYQLTALRNQGKFLAEIHEDVFDRLTMLIQQGFASFLRALRRPFGRDYFDAESRNISNLKDPVADQDAATKHWAREYLTSLISAIQGPINNALNIFFKGPDNLDYVVQDLSNTGTPAKGAALIGYNGGTVKGALDSLRNDGRPIVLLATGQSNMPQAVAYSWTPAPNLFLWNFDGNSQASTVVGTGYIPASSTTVGPALAAANVIALEFPRSKVYVINVYRGGLGIINWGPSPVDYNFRQAISGNVPPALAAAGKSKIDFFIFGGGESDANAQSQTLAGDIETLLMSWITSQSWSDAYIPTYIFGFSPWAQSSPGNLDYLWRRYSGSLKAAVGKNPTHRAYVGLDEFPISYFDSGSAIPYLHRTGEGYYRSGEKLGRTILYGVFEPVLRPDNLEGVYTANFTAPVNGTAALGFSYWTRQGNTISVSIRFSFTATAAGTCSFDASVPVKVKQFPLNVVGNVTTVNGGSGIVILNSNTQTVKLQFVVAASGVQAACAIFTYRAIESDILPNSPPGTT